MARTRRHNFTSDKGRAVALKKHKKRRRLSRKGHTGSWRVVFGCGREEFVSFAGSSDVSIVATNMHICGRIICIAEECIPVK